jgi:hypothetical protein
MSGMEFTWRMFGAIAWPAVVLVFLIVYRKWITEKLSSLAVKVGPVEAAVSTKVGTTGQDIAGVLADMPQSHDDGEIPASLVDLMPDVNQNRREGIRAAFNMVHRALGEYYPELKRVRPRRLPRAMEDLVEKGMMDPEVARSVTELYQLLEMPEWKSDTVGDTQGYAYLMLAEGTIHAIIRSVKARSEDAAADRPGEAPTSIGSSWRGIYNKKSRIELHIHNWNGRQFTGTMVYPDSGTTTRTDGRIYGKDPDGNGDLLVWEEQGYAQRGNRDIEFDGIYRASVSGSRMSGGWYRNNLLVAKFEMEAVEGD